MTFAPTVWEEVAGQLALVLRRQLGGRIRDLRVEVAEAGLVLGGRTSTFYAKQLAQHAAMQATGLRVVANDIAVD